MALERRIASLVGALAAAGVLAGGAALAVGRSDDDSPAERRAERAFTEAHVHQAALSRDQAEAVALGVHPGTVVDSQLEAEGDGLAWEIEVDSGREIWEVTVDAQSGRVLGTESEGSEGEDEQ